MIQRVFNYLAASGQPNNNIGGWYGMAYGSHKDIDTGIITRVEELGRISSNRAELKIITHVLYTICKKYEIVSNDTVHITTDNSTVFRWIRDISRDISREIEDERCIPNNIQIKKIMHQEKLRKVRIERAKNRIEKIEEKTVFKMFARKFKSITVTAVGRRRIVAELGD